MNRIYFLIIIILVISVLDSVANARAKDRCANVKAPFVSLRKKRHLTFPPGANIILTLSFLKALLVHAPSGWNLALEIDVLYPLPTAEVTNALFRKKFHHRQKRELWEIIDNALERYNMHGQSCIYRSICEARVHLAAPGKSLVHDILRSIFSLLVFRLRTKFEECSLYYALNAPVHDEEFKNEITETYRDLLESNFCERIHECPISLVEILLALNKNR